MALLAPGPHWRAPPSVPRLRRLAPLPLLRLPGVMPLLLLALAAALFLLPAGAVRVRADLSGRLPFAPSNALWVVFPPSRQGPGVTWEQYLALRRSHPTLAAFRIERRDWSVRRGPRAVTVVAMSANLPALLGAPAVAGRLPRRASVLFPQAQAWALARPELRHARYLLIAPAPLAGMPSQPLAQYCLDDLTFVRRLFAGVILLWLGLAGFDLIRLARREGRARLHHAAAYWLYAMASAASLGALLFVIFADLLADMHAASAASAVAGMLAFLLLARAGLRWCLDDQRYRCRTCLCRLRMPLERGRFGGILLAAHATEYLCPRGHGTLIVPAQPWQTHPQIAWRFTRDWWLELTAPTP